MVGQIPLSFPVQPSYGKDDFIETPSNRDALAWVRRYPDWSAPALVIFGEQGCGKTHLTQIWAGKDTQGNHIFDDADSLIGDEAQEKTLFHAYNLAKEQGNKLIITLSKSPEFLEFVLPDLASRLRASPQVEILSPDDIALGTVMVKLFHDRQLKVEPDVIAYILPRIERSFNALRSLVQRIDENALAEKRSVTIPLVRSLIAEPALF
jgi:chromosomal replication initiation ATPase DnaA